MFAILPHDKLMIDGLHAARVLFFTCGDTIQDKLNTLHRFVALFEIDTVFFSMGAPSLQNLGNESSISTVHLIGKFPKGFCNELEQMGTVPQHGLPICYACLHAGHFMWHDPNIKETITAGKSHAQTAIWHKHGLSSGFSQCFHEKATPEYTMHYALHFASGSKSPVEMQRFYNEHRLVLQDMSSTCYWAIRYQCLSGKFALTEAECKYLAAFQRLGNIALIAEELETSARSVQLTLQHCRTKLWAENNIHAVYLAECHNLLQST